MSLYLIALASLLIHEWAHGWTAARLGDPLPRLLGRHSLDPTAHLSIVGSVVVPVGLIALGLPVLGWGRPVPVSSVQLGRRALLIVLVAGPGANLLLAAVGMALGWSELVRVNLAIGLFNLLPVGPLDGRRILRTIQADGPAPDPDKIYIAREKTGPPHTWLEFIVPKGQED